MKNSSCEPQSSTTHRRNRRADLLAALGLFGVVFIAHFGSLSDGLFLDDHWHRVTLRDFGWGFGDLVESGSLDVPGPLVNLWWQEQPLQWRYARPVAILFMKIEFLLSGSSPVGMHICALVWHGLSTVLVYLLATWAIGRRGAGLLAGILFAIQPHSVFGVSWIAAQNAIVSGFFFLAAIYAYALAPVTRGGRAASLSTGRLLATLLLWGLALFSREIAIIFPLLVPVLDLTRGGKRLFVRRLPVYAGIFALTAGYLYWRVAFFPVASLPNIYFTEPTGATYLLWAASKLVHMVFALIFQTPLFLGLVTYDVSLSSQLALHGVMILLLAGFGWWYVRASRDLRARWFWPVWVVAAFVPVIPVFVMPHFGYLPAAALSVMFAVVLCRLRGWWRAVVTTFVIAGSLWSFGVYRYLWRGILRSEQLLYADIRANTPPPQPGSKLFFINLPPAGIYAAVAMRSVWGVDDLEGYVLTFAPHALMMEHPCVVERVGDRQLTISTESPGYFSGLGGRMLRDGMRPGSPLTAGTVVRGDLFDTEVLAGDDRGITKLQFTFHRPLNSDDFYFYISSPARPAWRLRFDATTDSIDQAHAILFEQAHADDPDARRRAREQIVILARPLAVQTGSPILTDLGDPQLVSDEALERVASWWRAAGASKLVREYDSWHEDAAEMLRERDIYFRIDGFARRAIRSDLFMTGHDSD